MTQGIRAAILRGSALKRLAPQDDGLIPAPNLVIAGLDPAIDTDVRHMSTVIMDARVKPGHDGVNKRRRA
jgi:hypothetical protein